MDSHDMDAAIDAALHTVIDPEIGLDIVTLGLVYDTRHEDGVVYVTFTLTTPRCPLESYITECIRAALYAVDGEKGVETELVWEPRWSAASIQGGAW